MDSLQCAYYSNRSTNDAIAALTHLEKKNTYVRMLFTDYSSTFKTIVPTKLIIKLKNLGLNHTMCNWIRTSPAGRPQVVRELATGPPSY